MLINEDNFIGQMRERNEDALKYVIEKYSGLVKAVIYKTLYMYPQDLEECIQDTFFKVWQNVKYYDETKNAFKNWVAAVAKYRAIDRLRQIQKTDIFLDTENDKFENFVCISNDDVFNDAIDDLLKCLSEEDRKLFIHIYIEGLSIDEVSNQTGKSKGVIYNHISRGKKKIICNNPLLLKKE